MGKGEQQEFSVPLHRDFFFAAVLDTLTQKIHAPCEFTEETAFFFRNRNSEIAPCKLLWNIGQPVKRHDDMLPNIMQKTNHQYKQRTQYAVYCRNAVLSVPDGVFDTSSMPSLCMSALPRSSICLRLSLFFFDFTAGKMILSSMERFFIIYIC